MNSEDLDDFTAELSRKWGFFAGIVSFNIYFIFDKYTASNKAALGALYISLILFTIRIYCRQTCKMWFWACVLFISGMDIGSVILFPKGWWPSSLFVLGMAAIIQMAMSLLIISTAGRRFGDRISNA